MHPFAPLDDLGAEVADMRDRPAEAHEPEPQEDE